MASTETTTRRSRAILKHLLHLVKIRIPRKWALFHSLNYGEGTMTDDRYCTVRTKTFPLWGMGVVDERIFFTVYCAHYTVYRGSSQLVAKQPFNFIMRLITY